MSIGNFNEHNDPFNELVGVTSHCYYLLVHQVGLEPTTKGL
jgi:hypothetical protein